MKFLVDKTCTTRLQTLIACPLYPSNPIAIGSLVNLGETFHFGDKNYIGFFTGSLKFQPTTLPPIKLSTHTSVIESLNIPILH